MKLIEYMLWKGLSVSDLAKDLGYTRCHISQLVRGTLKIKKENSLLEMVERYTQGYVSKRDAQFPDKAESIFVFAKKSEKQ